VVLREREVLRIDTTVELGLNIICDSTGPGHPDIRTETTTAIGIIQNSFRLVSKCQPNTDTIKRPSTPTTKKIASSSVVRGATLFALLVGTLSSLHLTSTSARFLMRVSPVKV